MNRVGQRVNGCEGMDGWQTERYAGVEAALIAAAQTLKPDLKNPKV